jgi:hypothetical protein
LTSGPYLIDKSFESLAVDELKSFAPSEGHRFVCESTARHQNRTRRPLVIDHAPELSNGPDPDASCAPVLALDDQALIPLLGDEVDPSVGAATTSGGQQVSLAPVVVLDIALELVRVERFNVNRPIESPATEPPSSDAGSCVKQNRSRQDPKEPLPEHSDHRPEGTDGR